MEKRPMKNAGIKLPEPLYAALIQHAGGKGRGRDGKMSALVRDYIERGLKQDGVKITPERDL